MILSGQLLLPDGPRACRLVRGQIQIAGDRILRVVEGDALGRPDIGHDRTLICPGFIDTHVHIPQFDCIGIDGLTLLDWLHRAVFPTEAKWADADHAGAVTTRVARRLLHCGTTGIAAYATVHHDAVKAAIQALHASGLRSIVGQVLMDQESPPELTRPARQLLSEAAALQGVGRVEVAITPRFAISCSRELLHGCGEIVRRSRQYVQTHLSETVPECEAVRRLHSESTYTDVYAAAGLLTERTVLAHGIYLSDAEKATIAKARGVVAHCPTANLFLQAGEMDRAGHQTSGVRIGLGSDVAGGPDPCMLRVARAMIETAKRKRLRDGQTPVPTPADAWWQITAGNADSLGWTDAGRLVAGAPADLLVIDPTIGKDWGGDQPAWTKAVDPLSVVMYGWDDRWLSRTIVNGQLAD